MCDVVVGVMYRISHSPSYLPPPSFLLIRLMILSALVVKTYRRSLECYVLVEAESLEGQRRFTNDALFTLALDNAEDKESTSIASTIVMPPHSAMETFANASIVRRQQRLELKTMLTRIYG